MKQVCSRGGTGTEEIRADDSGKLHTSQSGGMGGAHPGGDDCEESVCEKWRFESASLNKSPAGAGCAVGISGVRSSCSYPLFQFTFGGLEMREFGICLEN